MAGLSVRDPAVDRSLRSVFVGNIPYEATEEQLKDIFSEVGPVVSFRLVYDRETGKPKGYGFCEYQDQETALSAMRNLNGREFSGRALRVDNAASEKNKEELKSLGTGAPIIESPYGDPVNPEDAPESISRAVASLPPEQMFELMKQMKLCVQNSPQEARSMLLQNPQLAYALLQAQVVMRIVDPEIALQGGMHVNGAPPLMQPPMQGGVPAPGQMPTAVPGPGPGPGPLAPGVDNENNAFPSNAPSGNLQLSPVGPARPASIERVQVPMPDPRAPMQRGPMPASGPPPRGLLGDAPNDPRGGTLLSVTGEVEPRSYLGPPHQGPPMHHMPSHDNRGLPPHEMRGGPMGEPRPLMGEPRGPLMDGRGGRDPRGMEPRVMEPRVPNIPGPAMQATGMPGAGVQAAAQPGGFSPGQNQVTPQDHEKAALIMQVLQLTADQIAMLPPEQRQSILILKEQIQKSTGAP
ncbi:hypothetical protein JD844_004462 [Phrynosoma platyrhinos]|uniref:RRM domain-containing protein n=1 Tax=Phrynosoma platyrhinos TaxID=52577 RepID=A0ABQ7TNK8_PHRPL|nr:hypothetical protein JD844_004462 [Phrynosoma platyrhinos]